MQSCLANGVVSVHPPLRQMAQQAAHVVVREPITGAPVGTTPCDGSHYRVWNSRKRIAAPRWRAPNISVASDIELAIIPNSADQQVDSCPWPIIADHSRRPPRSTPRFSWSKRSPDSRPIASASSWTACIISPTRWRSFSSIWRSSCRTESHGTCCARPMSSTRSASYSSVHCCCGRRRSESSIPPRSSARSPSWSASSPPPPIGASRGSCSRRAATTPRSASPIFTISATSTYPWRRWPPASWSA